MPIWDANGHGDAGGGAGGWEEGDGWGGAWDSPSAARPDTSETRRWLQSCRCLIRSGDNQCSDECALLHLHHGVKQCRLLKLSAGAPCAYARQAVSVQPAAAMPQKQQVCSARC